MKRILFLALIFSLTNCHKNQKTTGGTAAATPEPDGIYKLQKDQTMIIQDPVHPDVRLTVKASDRGLFVFQADPSTGASPSNYSVTFTAADKAYTQIYRYGDSYSSSVIDCDGDGLPEYKETPKGLYRMSKVEWERIGSHQPKAPTEMPPKPEETFK